MGTSAAGPPPYATTLALVAAGLGIFVAALDQTVVVTALPQIFSDIEVPVTRLDEGAWIVTGYLVGYTAVMPLMGRVADAYGHARVYLASMLLFMAGSALVALADGLGGIVAARVLQAAGGGAALPVTLAIASHALPPSRRGLGIGVVAAVAEAGAVLGPLYGGLVLRFLDWRWIFWLNLPAVAPAAVLVPALVARRPQRDVRVDYSGGLLLGAALACLAIGLAGESALPGGEGWRAGLLIAAAVLAAAFALRERQTSAPLLPLAAFARAGFFAANGANFLVGGALILALVNIPLMTDTIMGQPPLEGGLRLLRLTAMIPVGAVLGGLLCHLAGYRLPTALGLLLAAASFAFLARWPLDVDDPGLTLHLMLGGFGFGVVIAPVTLAALESVHDDHKATASAFVTVMRMVGMTVGLAALSSWGNQRFATLVGRVPVPPPGAPADALGLYQAQVSTATLTFFHEMFIVAMAVCLAALLPALLMGRRARGP